MAVVTLYAASFKDPAAVNSVAPVFAEGTPRVVNTKAVTITSGDSINSKVYLGKIQSSAIPDLASLIYHDSLTSLNDFDIGVEYNGVAVDIDVFADGLDLTSAGSKSVFAAITRANTGKRVWELLGLSSDPGRVYDIIGTLKAASGATGVVAAQIRYAK
jgi:hypothetical protein